MKKHLILPVEIKDREWLAKLHLAIIAAHRGMVVIIGKQSEIRKNIFSLPGSIYLDKYIGKLNKNFYIKISKCGHKITSLCEEGLVYRSKKVYQVERLDLNNCKLLSAFFVWGKTHFNDVKEILKDQVNIYPVGNPRVDLLKLKMHDIWSNEVLTIKKRYGKFILVNSSFSKANLINQNFDVISMQKRRGTLVNNTKYYLELINHIDSIKIKFIEMLIYLSQNFPQKKFIFKTHPNENFSFWIKIFKPYKNIFVVKSGSSIPYIIASSAVIHNSCTSGVEAFLLKKPVYAYMPFENKKVDSFLPNEVSNKIKSLNALKKAILGGLVNKNIKYKKRVINEYISNYDGSFFSTDEIVTYLDNIMIDSQSITQNFYKFIYTLIGKFKFFIKKYFLYYIYSAHDSINNQKFSGVSESEILYNIAKIKKLRGIKSNFTIKKFSKSDFIYQIELKD